MNKEIPLIIFAVIGLIGVFINNSIGLIILIVWLWCFFGWCVYYDYNPLRELLKNGSN